MKQCPRCGSYADDSAQFCTTCGAAMTAANAPAAQFYAGQPQTGAQQGAPAATTKQAFLAMPENAKMKRELFASAIICYICAVISLVMIVLVSKNFLGLVDVAILAGLGLGIHLKQSKVCAIILLVYAVVNAVLMTLQNGTLSGWLPLIAGIYAVIYTLKLDKAWKAYQQRSSQNNNVIY